LKLADSHSIRSQAAAKPTRYQGHVTGEGLADSHLESGRERWPSFGVS
jgi:hypothetical protein